MFKSLFSLAIIVLFTSVYSQLARPEVILSFGNYDLINQPIKNKTKLDNAYILAAYGYIEKTYYNEEEYAMNEASLTNEEEIQSAMESIEEKFLNEEENVITLP